MKTNITKIGGSFYVLIPSFIVREFNLKNGDPLEMIVEKDRVLFILERR